MSALPEIQQIPARHGTATFVPKGHMIKIVNTYGRQVVDTWAFALPKAPTQEEVDEQNSKHEEAQRAGDEAQAAGEGEEVTGEVEQGEGEGEVQAGAEEEKAEGEGEEGKEEEKEEEEAGEKKEEEGEKEEQAAQKVPGSETETDGEKTKEAAEKATPPKSGGWSAYIPTVPSMSITRSRGKAPAADDAAKAAKKPADKAGEKRTWASYFPSGQGFSNYIPTNTSVSAFASSHYRDPTKSYAEQLYDFSKTPVGAGALSAASGGGYASTAYAAYQAYTKSLDASKVPPPMEYLSMPHTHTSILRLVPRVDDTLVSNLRKPMLTVVEDTSASHDTVIAACDPQRYRELGVDKWEEHGSCAENLVLALKELNERAGLRGNTAVGTDVTVNTVPPPLNLFMNVPVADGEGSGALKFENPKGKKGEFIRLRAERDVVVVMSACPMDVTPVNGGKCMAAHFVVQEPSASDKKAAAAPAAAKSASRPAPKKLPSSAKKVPQAAKAQQPAATPAAKPASSAPAVKPPQKSAAAAPAARKASQPNAKPAAPVTNGATARKASDAKAPQPPPKAGRPKPKKLERRTPSGVSQSSSAKA